MSQPSDSHLVSPPNLVGLGTFPRAQYIRMYPPYWRPFRHPQPVDASCSGDRDPLATEFAVIKVLISAIEIRVVTIIRNSSLQVVNFDCTMFRPIYKEPSVRLKGYQKESSVQRLDLFYVVLVEICIT